MKKLLLLLLIFAACEKEPLPPQIFISMTHGAENHVWVDGGCISAKPVYTWLRVTHDGKDSIIHFSLNQYGDFRVLVRNLKYESEYFVYAVARNEGGLSYSDTIEFRTSKKY